MQAETQVRDNLTDILRPKSPKEAIKDEDVDALIADLRQSGADDRMGTVREFLQRHDKAEKEKVTELGVLESFVEGGKELAKAWKKPYKAIFERNEIQRNELRRTYKIAALSSLATIATDFFFRSIDPSLEANHQHNLARMEDLQSESPEFATESLEQEGLKATKPDAPKSVMTGVLVWQSSVSTAVLSDLVFDTFPKVFEDIDLMHKKLAELKAK